MPITVVFGSSLLHSAVTISKFDVDGLVGDVTDSGLGASLLKINTRVHVIYHNLYWKNFLPYCFNLDR